uniref:NADH:ubiquinone reductase (H(+)-translocating) n=1 Tax=Blattisocius tarsalis TaxID=1609195 RepID=A0A6B9WEC8_9ACAR|nr:NADH dehydrogenase subunit 5 [Blattisocius tarsalis]QHQ98570.1 NADH dehydrogenase subunit 5 [Blattisocius tarsalis]
MNAIMSLFGMLTVMYVGLTYTFLVKGMVCVMEIEIFKLGILGFNLYLYLDWVSIIFLLVVSLIMSCTVYYSKSYMLNESNLFLFMLLLSGFVFSMYIMVVSMNMWMIMMGWDGLGVTSYLLITYYQSSVSNFSSMVTMLSNRMGDVGMILGGVVMMGSVGSMDVVSAVFLQESTNLMMVMLIFGGFTKSAQMPFSVWLPMAMAAPTPVSALVHSSTLVAAGAYLMVRFGVFLGNSSVVFKWFMLMCLFTLLMSSVMALVEVDIKSVIALSTMSQLSLMIFVILVGSEVAGLYHLLMHALYKALLFLCSGVFIHSMWGGQDIRNYGVCYKMNGVVGGVFMVCGASLMGFPYMSGFYSKDLILDIVVSMNFNLFVMGVVLLSVMCTVLYFMRLLYWGVMSYSKGVLISGFGVNDSMVKSLLLCYIFVLCGGAGVNWVVVDMFEGVYMGLVLKLLSLIIFMLGMGVFIYFTGVSMLRSHYLGSMFYFMEVQSKVVSGVFQSLGFVSMNAEFMLESGLIKKLGAMVINGHKKVFLMKFMVSFMSIWYMLVAMFVM